MKILPQRFKKQLPGFISGIVAVLTIVTGIPAAIDMLSPDDPIDYQAGFPPAFYPEASVRNSSNPFSSFLAGPFPGGTVQVVIQAINNGGSDATGVELRAALEDGLRMVPGSCRMRTSGEPHLKGCSDNITNGGFSYQRFGRGSWVQVYFNTSIPRAAIRGDTYAITAVGDTDETAEMRDTAMVGVGVAM